MTKQVQHLRKYKSGRVSRVNVGVRKHILSGNPKKNIVDDTLIKEAKKYDDVEDFIKAYWTPVYHGTNHKFDKFRTPSGHPGSEGIFVAPSRSNAEYYRRSDKGEIKELFLGKLTKIWDYENQKDVEALQQKIVEFIPENKNRQKWNELITEKNKIVERAIHKNNTLTIRTEDLFKYKQLQKDIDNFPDFIGEDPKALANKISEGWYVDLSKALKNTEIKKWFKQNYDGWKQIDHTDYGYDISFGVFNPNSLKTKSQIIEIWRKSRNQ